jgi:hypothetical protein
MMLDARALDAVRFRPAQLYALYGAIRVNDAIDPQVAAPAAVRLDYKRGELIEAFCLSRQLWREGFDRAALIKMATGLRRDEPFDPEMQQWFKHARAKFKHLRFAFVLYAADHRCPVALKAITTVMGQLQDAVRSGRRGAVIRQAGLLRVLLGPLPQQRLAREVDRLAPSDTAGFSRFVAGQMASLREMLAHQTMTGHRFHAGRKIISRQVSFHDDMRTLSADPDHAAMSRYLAAINGLMGKFHDDLVVRHARGELNYARDNMVVPPDISDRLRTLVALYP